MALRCLRTQLISSIEAPDASSARLTACLSAETQALGRRAQQSRSAAGNERDDQVVLSETPDEFEDTASSCFASRVRHRVRGFDDFDALAGRAVAVAGDDEAGKLAGPMFSKARAIAADALPAPTTIVRPFGAAGR